MRSLSIGVQLIGDDANNTPPAHAVARRGLIRNVRGYPVYGDCDRPNRCHHRQRRQRSASQRLRVQPVSPAIDDALWPMTYDISMGVRKGNRILANRVNVALAEHRAEIEELLREYGVPLL